MKPPRGYEALRQHRVSIPDASYFVTLCTWERKSGLTSDIVAEAIVTELSAMKSTRSFEPRAWVIMPDHLHLFFHLTEKLSLGQVVGRLKTKTRAALAAQNLAWQGNYYEHRLRPDDPVEDVLRYIFLNPYRAGLLEPSAKYSHFSLCDEDAAWFTATLDDQRPFPDWLVTS